VTVNSLRIPGQPLQCESLRAIQVSLAERFVGLLEQPAGLAE
jgi:hypothetical protein